MVSSPLHHSKSFTLRPPGRRIPFIPTSLKEFYTSTPWQTYTFHSNITQRVLHFDPLADVPFIPTSLKEFYTSTPWQTYLSFQHHSKSFTLRPPGRRTFHSNTTQRVLHFDPLADVPFIPTPLKEFYTSTPWQTYLSFQHHSKSFTLRPPGRRTFHSNITQRVLHFDPLADVPFIPTSLKEFYTSTPWQTYLSFQHHSKSFTLRPPGRRIPFIPTSLKEFYTSTPWQTYLSFQHHSKSFTLRPPGRRTFHSNITQRVLHFDPLADVYLSFQHHSKSFTLRPPGRRTFHSTITQTVSHFDPLADVPFIPTPLKEFYTSTPWQTYLSFQHHSKSFTLRHPGKRIPFIPTSLKEFYTSTPWQTYLSFQHHSKSFTLRPPGRRTFHSNITQRVLHFDPLADIYLSFQHHSKSLTLRPPGRRTFHSNITQRVLHFDPLADGPFIPTSLKEFYTSTPWQTYLSFQHHSKSYTLRPPGRRIPFIPTSLKEFHTLTPWQTYLSFQHHSNSFTLPPLADVPFIPTSLKEFYTSTPWQTYLSFQHHSKSFTLRPPGRRTFHSNITQRVLHFDPLADVPFIPTSLKEFYTSTPWQTYLSFQHHSKSFTLRPPGRRTFHSNISQRVLHFDPLADVPFIPTSARLLPNNSATAITARRIFTHTFPLLPI